MRKSTFFVTITPVAREDAGYYQVTSDIIEVPDDVDFLTLYAADSLDQALGYFDFCMHGLEECKVADLDWLDSLNQCLFFGDLARISIYQVTIATHSMQRLTEAVLTVGGDVKK